MTDLTDALHSRRAALHSLIRAHADEIADIDRLLIRHDPTFDPSIDVVLAAAPGLVSHAFRDAFAAARSAMQHDDRPPADAPHVDEAAVVEAGVEPAPHGLPRPSLDIAETNPTGGRRQTPRPSDRGEPDLPCDHCDRVFPTKQSLASHTSAAHGAGAEGGRFTWDYAKVAEVAASAVARGQSAARAVQDLNPGCSSKAAGVAMAKARKLGHEIPYVRQFDRAAPGPRPGMSARPTMSAVEAAEAAVLDGAA